MKVFQGEWPHLPGAAGKYSHNSPANWPLDLLIWRLLRITIFYTKKMIWDGGGGYCTSAFEWGQLCKLNSIGQHNSAGDSPKIWVIICHSLLMTVSVYFRQSWFIPVVFNNDTDFHFQMFSSCDNKISGYIIYNSIIKGCGLNAQNLMSCLESKNSQYDIAFFWSFWLQWCRCGRRQRLGFKLRYCFVSAV